MILFGSKSIAIELLKGCEKPMERTIKMTVMWQSIEKLRVEFHFRLSHAEVMFIIQLFIVNGIRKYFIFSDHLSFIRLQVFR